MGDRIVNLRNSFLQYNIQGMIVSNPINIKYLIGLDAEGLLLINNDRILYITDSRYTEYAKNEKNNEQIEIADIINFSKEDYTNFFNGADNVGIEENYITYKTYMVYKNKFSKNEFVSADALLDSLREIKDEEEIDNIRKACEITDLCFEFLLKYIKPGMTEKQIAREIECFYINHADGISFDPIVASGENSSKPHAIPGQRKINRQDIITIDMGCKVNGYCSDMTRTIFVGNLTEEQRKIYEIVLNSQLNSLSRMTPGNDVIDISKIVIDDFESYGYKLIHALGHGVGLDIHEKPIISTRLQRILKENMTITNEPGIYLEGNFGIRIEDTLRLATNKPEILTKSNKDIIVI